MGPSGPVDFSVMYHHRFRGSTTYSTPVLTPPPRTVPASGGLQQDPMVHRYALSALSPLAYIPENGSQIIDAGGVSAVKNTLQYHSGDPQVAISALSI